MTNNFELKVLSSIVPFQSYATNTSAYHSGENFGAPSQIKGIMLHTDINNLNPAMCMHFFPSEETRFENNKTADEILLTNINHNSWNEKNNNSTDGYHIIIGMGANGKARAFQTLPLTKQAHCTPLFYHNIIKDYIVNEAMAMIWPVPGYNRISSPFGYRIHPIDGVKKFHSGIDIPAPTGTNIIAVSDGVVVTAGWVNGYGNLVEIRHDEQLSTKYGHNSKLLVKKGQQVRQGDVIAEAGSTGNSTGPHCHFEVRIDGVAKNPQDYLNTIIEPKRTLSDNFDIAYNPDINFLHIYICGFDNNVWKPNGPLQNFKSPIDPNITIAQETHSLADIAKTYYNDMMNLLISILAHCCEVYRIEPFCTHAEKFTATKTDINNDTLYQRIEIPNIISYDSYKFIMEREGLGSQLDPHSFEPNDKFLEFISQYSDDILQFNLLPGENALYSLLIQIAAIVQFEAVSQGIYFATSNPTEINVQATEDLEGGIVNNPDGLCAICQALCESNQLVNSINELSLKMPFLQQDGSIHLGYLNNADNIFKENESIFIQKESLNQIMDFINEVYRYGAENSSGHNCEDFIPFIKIGEGINRYFTEDYLTASIYNKICSAMLSLPELNNKYSIIGSSAPDNYYSNLSTIDPIEEVK